MLACSPENLVFNRTVYLHKNLCVFARVCVCTVIVYITVEGAKDYFAGDHFVLLR